MVWGENYLEHKTNQKTQNNPSFLGKIIRFLRKTYVILEKILVNIVSFKQNKNPLP